MPVERAAGGTSLIDVLDRVLDKGIVIDAWVRVSVVGIDLITVEARVVVASIETFLRYSDHVTRTPTDLTVKQLAHGVQLQLAYGARSVPPTEISGERRLRAVRARAHHKRRA